MLYAIAQLRSQFEAVVMDKDLARTFKGKISPVTTLCISLALLDISPLDMGKNFPSDRAPRCCKKEDVNTDEGNSCLLCCEIMHDDIS